MKMIMFRPGRISSLGLLVVALIGYGGCAKNKESASSVPAVPSQADSVAFKQAASTEDDGQRLAALQGFVKAHPNNQLCGDAYPEILRLALKNAPDTVPAILKDFTAVDYPSANPYNNVGWQLAEAGKDLDMAVPILVKAVAKARAAGDQNNLASCLDSEAWARYKAGDAKAAVAPMEEARRLFTTADDEIDRHMAFIYDASQMPEKAQPIYVALLSHMEDPDIRERLTRTVSASGGSMAEVDSQIQSARAAAATPCPDFTLPNLAGGKPISLADYRGKVVLLNFWHYT